MTTVTKSNPNNNNKVSQAQKAFDKKYNFLKIKQDGRTKKVTGVFFNKFKYIETLKNEGFVRFPIDKKPHYIKVIDNVAEFAENYELLDAFQRQIEAIPKKELFEAYGIYPELLLAFYFDKLSALTNEALLTRLEPVSSLYFQEDTKDKSFFYYQNGFVQVDKEGVHFKPYSELKGIVFKTQILQRDYIAIRTKKEESTWYKFLENIAGSEHRFKALLSIIGYTLHHYFHTKRKAVILTDSRMGEEANGRSGKGILVEGVRHMMNPTDKDKEAVNVSGKNFSANDRFRYQECDINTKLVHINDAKRGLNIEEHFVDITDGIQLQKKNSDSSTIPVKIIFSTNRTIRIPSGSAADRVIEYELADHYSADFSPMHEFKEWFFRDWDKNQWAVFDNIMLDAVAHYFEHGIVDVKPINLIKRKLQEETAPEFLAFMDDRVFGKTDLGKPIYQWGEWLQKKGLYEAFLAQNPDFMRKKFFHQRTFTNWLRLFVKYDERISEKHSDEKRSNGKDLICFHNTKQHEENEKQAKT